MTLDDPLGSAARAIEGYVTAAREDFDATQLVRASPFAVDHGNAAGELKRRDGSPWGPTPIDTFGALVAMTHTAMIDHLVSTAVLLPSPANFGPMVTSRAAIEAAGKVQWLLEPATTRERIQRSFAVRVAGLRELERSANRVETIERERVAQSPVPASIDARLMERVEQMRRRPAEAIAEARDLGIPVHRPPKDAPHRGWNLKLAAPGLADFAHLALSRTHMSIPRDLSELAYSTLSGVSHSGYDALRQSIDDTSVTAVNGRRVVRMGGNVIRLAQIGAVALLTGAAATLRAMAYFGQSADGVAGELDRWADTIEDLLRTDE